MPESPVSGSGEFSAPPPGKKSLNADELKNLVDGPLSQAAKVLGGESESSTAPVVIEAPAVAEIEAEPFDVSDEDKKKYIRSLLGQEPFTKVYDLFGGTLKVAFRTRTSEEARQILAASAPARFDARVDRSLLAVELMSDQGPAPVLLGTLDDVAASAVYAAFKDFELLCDELFRKANDPHFWTGIAGLT